MAYAWVLPILPLPAVSRLSHPMSFSRRTTRLNNTSISQIRSCHFLVIASFAGMKGTPLARRLCRYRLAYYRLVDDEDTPIHLPSTHRAVGKSF